jgi:TRAP-type mannitol/chloroaromatic compound transport system permease large subunit
MRSLAPKEITLIDIYRSIWPFAIIMMLTIALLMAFPQLALWLPERMAVKG